MTCRCEEYRKALEDLLASRTERNDITGRFVMYVEPEVMERSCALLSAPPPPSEERHPGPPCIFCGEPESKHWGPPSRRTGRPSKCPPSPGPREPRGFVCFACGLAESDPSHHEGRATVVHPFRPRPVYDPETGPREPRGARCGARPNPDNHGHGIFECEEPKGHDGPHRSGLNGWTCVSPAGPTLAAPYEWVAAPDPRETESNTKGGE